MCRQCRCTAARCRADMSRSTTQTSEQIAPSGDQGDCSSQGRARWPDLYSCYGSVFGARGGPAGTTRSALVWTTDAPVLPRSSSSDARTGSFGVLCRKESRCRRSSATGLSRQLTLADAPRASQGIAEPQPAGVTKAPPGALGWGGGRRVRRGGRRWRVGRWWWRDDRRQGDLRRRRQGDLRRRWGGDRQCRLGRERHLGRDAR